jgi:hypothetical protein
MSNIKEDEKEIEKILSSVLPGKYFTLKMYVSIAVLIIIQSSIIYLLTKLNNSFSEYIYSFGLSFLSVCVYKITKMYRVEEFGIFSKVCHWSFIIFAIWGFIRFDWYLPIFSIFILSFPIKSIGRILLLRMWRSNSGFHHLHWINIFIVIGFIFSLTGLLIN